MHKFRKCIFRGNCYLASPASSFEEKCPSMSMRIDSVYYPTAPLSMTVRNQKRKHCAGVENGLKQTWRLSVQVCMLLSPWFAVLLHQKTNYLLTKIFHELAKKNKMKRKTRKRSAMLSQCHRKRAVYDQG